MGMISECLSSSVHTYGIGYAREKLRKKSSVGSGYRWP